MGRGRSLDTSAFVGRSAIVEWAASIVTRRRSAGRSRAVVFAGETGVGKSRLATEVAAVVAAAGVDLAVVRVTPAMGALPLGALATVITLGDHDRARRVDLLVAAADALLAEPERLLVVDDAHLLDATTAGVLHQAASRGAPRLLLTLRTDEPVDPAVVALWKDDLAERIDLAPLDRAHTDELAATLLGAPLDGVSANDLWQVSRGNALFVRELLVGALDAGLVIRHGDVHRFTAPPRSSARLGELLGARLEGLDLDEREVLDLLALAGELGLGFLRTVVSDEVLARLEERHLIAIDTDGRRVPVRLVHPLYGELLREQMGKIRELAAYRLLADRLEGFGARRHNDVLDLARWRLLGGGDTRPALLLDAARQALCRFDAELARDLAELAHRLGVGVDAELVVAQALEQQGRHREAAAVLDHALADATSDDAVVRAAMAASVIEFWSLGDEATAMATVRAARDRVDDPDLVRQLDAHAATFAAMANRPREALERVADHLAADLDTVGRQRTFTVAAVAAGPALTVVGRALDAIELVERCVPIRLALGDDEALPDAFKHIVGKVFAMSEAGALPDASAAVVEAYDAASLMRAVPGVAWAAMLRGRVALMIGHLDEAATFCGEAAELFDDLDEQGLRSWSLAGVVLAAAMRGDARRAAERMAVLDTVDPGPVVAMQADLDRARAWSQRVAGDVRGSVATLERGLADADERGAVGMSVSLLHDLVRVGAEGVGRLVGPPHRAVQGSLASIRIDLVDAVAGDDPAALDACRSEFESLGSPMFAAETAALAAASYRRQGTGRRAAALVAEGRRLHRRCREVATPLLAPVAGAAELTPREREVAELAVAGFASREIADRLDRSIRTVENHLQRVYEKLGVEGRPGLRDALGVPPGAGDAPEAARPTDVT